MSRQEILDDPAAACPELRQFLGGYFHQDWVVDRQRWEEVVDDFIAESPRGVVVECAAELGGVLAEGFDEGELAAILERLGGSIDPAAHRLSTDDWLHDVLQRLSAPGEPADH